MLDRSGNSPTCQAKFYIVKIAHRKEIHTGAWPRVTRGFSHKFQFHMSHAAKLRSSDQVRSSGQSPVKQFFSKISFYIFIHNFTQILDPTGRNFLCSGQSDRSSNRSMSGDHLTGLRKFLFFNFLGEKIFF